MHIYFLYSFVLLLLSPILLLFLLFFLSYIGFVILAVLEKEVEIKFIY